jgi:hypothetical protein
MIEKVKILIDDYHKKTGGKCGFSIPDIQQQSNVSTDDLKPILRQLYEEKYIFVREWLNGKLIFREPKSKSSRTKKPAQ